MTTFLSKGANAPLHGPQCRVSVLAGVPVDVSAVLLGPDGKVRSDHDLVFYNHPAQDGVAVAGSVVTADLTRVPPSVQRVAVVASIDVDHPHARFDAHSTPRANIASGSQEFMFAPPPMTHGETVVILAELYRRQDVWKVRAVGQGWSNGLAGLAADFGIVVDDPGTAPTIDTSATSPASAHVSTPLVQETRRSFTPPALPSPAQPARPLGKVALTKGGQATINMRKEDPGLVITASLEWNGGSRARRRAGADLDLYALYVPRASVTPKGPRPTKSEDAIYYRNLGSVSAPPFIALDGDARTPGRETITIHRPDLQGYVLICAYSAVENGTGSFKSYGARAVVTDGRGSTVTAPLYSDRNLSYWVAIALIDFTAPDGVQIRHVEKYSGNHQEARPVLYSNGNFCMSVGPVEFKTR
ncbi:TerD family protein [Thermomonospora cellulosilytica]|uniref:Stress response protein SCP2 n=1 Tax=Thermomonospora cellulosilytica TaxID=1411118 RepID=A0A7W3N4G2_9ACTN|nr:TerD family protein [Thermomonospora cellulosilytica]MBA9007282.1 stress response protein SCP2 [Thermomonospora cellulosilytica]